MAEIFANGARGRLLTGISSGATSATLRLGQGMFFPAFGAGDYAPGVLEQGTAATPVKREVVQVTARSSDTLTITRAQQGTTALAFDAGSRVELRLTAATMESFRDYVGFDRRFPSGGMNPENSSGLKGYGALSVQTTSSSTHPTPTLVTRGTSIPRVRFSVSGANTQVIGLVATPSRSVLGATGSSPNLGGFEYLLYFTLDFDTLGARKFLGLSSAVVSDRFAVLEPSLRVSDAVIGVGQQSTTPVGPGGTWQVYHHNGDGFGPVSQVSTPIAKVVGNLMQLRLWSPRGQARWFVELVDLDANARYFESFTSNIPLPTHGLTQALVSRRTAAGTDGFTVHDAWVFPW